MKDEEEILDAWELGHKSGRLTAPLLRNALAAARRAGADPVLALWGDRLS